MSTLNIKRLAKVAAPIAALALLAGCETATPYQPLESMSWTPLVVMALVAAALTWAGIDRFTRRDVQPA